MLTYFKSNINIGSEKQQTIIQACYGKTCVLFEKICIFRFNECFVVVTRRSKIVSRAVARRAGTSVDHLRCAAVLKIACVICTC